MKQQWMGLLGVVLGLALVAVPVVAQEGGLTARGAVVLPSTEAGLADSRSVFSPFVVEQGRAYAMFYTSYDGTSADGAISISLATSPDGVTWAKHPNNPIIRQPEVVKQVAFPSVFIDSAGTWVMLFNVTSIQNGYPGSTLRRATAPDAAGPWTIDAEPILRSDLKRWDAKLLAANVVSVEGGYRLYYTGLTQRFENPQIGMATSSDGLTWAFYDDPATTDDLHNGSDPIFSGVTTPITAGTVLETATGYELFYLNLDRPFTEAYTNDAPLLTFSRATSSDGLTWTPSEAVLELPQRAWVTLHVRRINGQVHVYYDEWQSHGIGLLLGPLD